MGKEDVLAALRGALGPAHAGDHAAEPLPYPAGRDPRASWPSDPGALCDTFVAEFDRLARYEDQRFGAAWRVHSTEEARDRVTQLFAREDLHRVCAVPGPLVEEVIPPALRGAVQFDLVTTPEAAGSRLADYDLGITDCLCLAAGTGSVLVSTEEGGSRAVSLLPPVHLVLARLNQLVPDIPDVVDRIVSAPSFPKLPAAYTFITGSSRTSDIEKVLVVPAHGPREVFVIILP